MNRLLQALAPFLLIALLVCLQPQLLWSQAAEQDRQVPADIQANEDDFYLQQVKPILVKNCYECHANDPENISGGLALTSRDAIARGGESGPAIDAEKIGESILLQAVNYEVYEMPPTGQLAQPEIDILTKWVEMGIPFPAGEEIDSGISHHSTVPQVNAETKRWWSFQPVQRPELPVPTHVDWPRNSIDNFILEKLEALSLTPAPPATRQQLIRRVYYDLIGLPPSPAEVAAFVSDADPQAYEKLIECLLVSPHYGEKWGRHWMDLVRYAESNSFERDGTKPFVWRYRDYVIRSFNEDKPYDRFLIEQLAGDELPESTPEALIATGYYRLGAWDDEPADPLQAKYDDLDDIVATTAHTMLGLSVNCARCHDHKIDPIPQSDYYSFVAFFENVRRFGVRSPDSVDDASVKIIAGPATPEQQQEHVRAMAEATTAIASLEAIVKPDFESVEHEEFSYEANRLRLIRKRVGGLLTEQQFQEYEQAFNRQRTLQQNPPGSYKVLCVTEEGSTPPTSFIRVRGNAGVQGAEVQPGFISVLSPPTPELARPVADVSTGRRLALAKWIASPDNPLTARVMANRLWQFHFGRGIVRSSSDFGFQGTPPTHPDLLNWLAAELVQQRWSLKAMHRLIMNSSAYQMSSQYNPAAHEIDPANDFLWRFDLRRQTAEEIRDSILAVSGQLNLDAMFGPSIFPIQPPEVLAGQSQPGAGWESSSESDRRRRSIYIHVKRSLPVPILATNDSAETDNTCPVRFITTQPTQSLGMMNSEFTNEQARHFAKSVAAENPELTAQVAEILQRVTQRRPAPAEVQRGIAMIEDLKLNESLSAEQALETFCLLALNLNEFVFID